MFGHRQLLLMLAAVLIPDAWFSLHPWLDSRIWIKQNKVMQVLLIYLYSNTAYPTTQQLYVGIELHTDFYRSNLSSVSLIYSNDVHFECPFPKIYEKLKINIWITEDIERRRYRTVECNDGQLLLRFKTSRPNRLRFN